MKVFGLSVLIFVLAGINSGCSSLTKDLLKDPEVKVTDFQVTGVSLEDVSVNLLLNVKNPNPIPVKLDQVQYTLNFSGEKVTEGSLDKGLDIPASGENTVSMPLKFKYSSVGNIISSLLKNTFTKEYELNGTAKMGIFNVPFSKKGEVKFTK